MLTCFEVRGQHAYSVTNIEEDGTGFEFAAPDAVVSLEPNCDASSTVRVVVRNLGEAPLARGVVVEVVTSSCIVLGTVASSRVLGPAQSEGVVFAITDSAVLNGTATVFARITSGVLRECRAGKTKS